MRRTLIKICGITRVGDAVAAARLGADFVGMVLHADGPRRIDLARARDIMASLPRHVTPVGVFVDAPTHELVQACETIGLGHVQLHGGESPEYVQSLPGLRVWKVLRAGARLRLQVNQWTLQPIDALLFDSARGGSGEANDWRSVAKVRAALDRTRFIVAGGLLPETVGDVVRTLRPWAVDVSSGVEGSVKGIKSEPMIDDFIRAVRAADESA
jgi:phosphoribosylanthranilate isomerase